LEQRFAVLVLSCDKYSDVWPAFFKCFRASFPAGSWPVYLGANTKVCGEPGVTTLLSGDDPDWSTSYKRILRQIPEAKLFVILEDLFAASRVDEDLLSKSLAFLFSSDAKHLRYWPGTKIDAPTEDADIGRFARGAPYRSTVCGFWDREYLLGLLLEGESPWDFEIVGSYRTSYVDGFYGLTKPLFEFRNMIEKGSWIPESVQWAKANGVELDLERRPLLVGRRQLTSRLKMAYFRMMMRVPWQKRVKWMNTLRRALISY
jgi:hypothetical protein